MEEIAQETGISAEDLVLALEAVSEVESLSQTIYSGDGTPVLLSDRLPDRKDRNEELLNRMLLLELLKLLPEEEQEIIRLRYFEDCTQVQVAGRLGMTQVQVSRAEKRILKKLRESGTLATLSDKLREAAALREENPELTIEELGALCDPPVTKSGLNHRLRKLSELASSLK